MNRFWFKDLSKGSWYLSGYFGANAPIWPNGGDSENEFSNQILEVELGGEANIPKAESLFRQIRQKLGPGVALISNFDSKRIGWEFVGFDVVELPDCNWSAIEMHESYMSSEAFLKWRIKLNRFGLFEQIGDASDLLEQYMMSEDPDRGFHGLESSQIANESYGIIPIWNFNPSDGTCKNEKLKNSDLNSNCDGVLNQ